MMYVVMMKTRMTDHFNFELFTCKCGCGSNKIDYDFVLKLLDARKLALVPFVISSGYRCAKHNKNEGGKSDSALLSGLAANITYRTGYEFYNIINGLMMAGFLRIGINLDKQLVHVDVDKSKPYPTIFRYLGE